MGREMMRIGLIATGTNASVEIRPDTSRAHHPLE
jgi:hypothetical protein